MYNGPNGKEREEIERFLQKFDSDGDGRISKDEIQDFLKRHGKWFPGIRARSAMSANDFNKNGVIDTPQEIAAFMKHATDHWKRALAAATPRTLTPNSLPLYAR